MALRQKYGHIIPIAVILQRSALLQPLHQRLIVHPAFFLIGSQQTEHRFRMPFMNPLRRLQQLVDSLILHQPQDGKKHHLSAVSGRILRRICLRMMLSQVHAGTGNDPAFSRYAALFLHEIPVPLILKEHTGRLFHRCPVHENDHPLQESLMLQSGSKPRDIDKVRRFRHSGRKAAVNVRLDGIGEHSLRPVTLHQTPVEQQKLQILEWVHAPPLKGGGQILTAKLPQALHVSGIRNGNHNPFFLGQKRLEHLLAEIVQAGIAVG